MPDNPHDTPGADDAPGVSDDALHAHEEHDGPFGSLRDDLEALYDDSRTYLEAEVAFQKARVAYGAHHIRSAAIYGLSAVAFLNLAMLGLVIGLIIALRPYLGAFGAMGLMVAIMFALTAGAAWLALRRIRRIGEAFEKKQS